MNTFFMICLSPKSQGQLKFWHPEYNHPGRAYKTRKGAQRQLDGIRKRMKISEDAEVLECHTVPIKARN